MGFFFQGRWIWKNWVSFLTIHGQSMIIYFHLVFSTRIFQLFMVRNLLQIGNFIMAVINYLRFSYLDNAKNEFITAIMKLPICILVPFKRGDQENIWSYSGHEFSNWSSFIFIYLKKIPCKNSPVLEKQLRITLKTLKDWSTEILCSMTMVHILRNYFSTITNFRLLWCW